MLGHVVRTAPHNPGLNAPRVRLTERAQVVWLTLLFVRVGLFAPRNVDSGDESSVEGVI